MGPHTTQIQPDRPRQTAKQTAFNDWRQVQLRCFQQQPAAALLLYIQTTSQHSATYTTVCVHHAYIYLAAANRQNEAAGSRNYNVTGACNSCQHSNRTTCHEFGNSKSTSVRHASGYVSSKCAGMRSAVHEKPQ